MATNKNTVSETDTKTAAAETENPVVNTEAGNPAAPPAGATPPAKIRYEGVTNFAYVGPSLPGGRLKNNTVLNGTYAEITEYYKDAIALYPNVARLIVPVSRLAESREKTENSGNILYKYCTELVAAFNAKGEEQ